MIMTETLNEIIESPKIEKVQEIKQMIGECHKKISDVQLEIKRIQDEECLHFNIIEVYKSDTGNWSVSDDSYWKEVWCEDCGKTATYDSNEPGYREKGFFNGQK